MRAEVALALSAETPDVAVLTAALERVDTLLAKARAELVAAVKEIQLLPEPGGSVGERAPEVFPVPWRGTFPW
ncbi:MAG TPA: hypothetical protein VJR89_16805 [Polyangiales bacterium]|nr:hypothetical protein [Polyangiales bacterium]